MDAGVRVLVRAVSLCCKYIREGRMTSIPPVHHFTRTHKHTHAQNLSAGIISQPADILPLLVPE